MRRVRVGAAFCVRRSLSSLVCGYVSAACESAPTPPPPPPTTTTSTPHRTRCSLRRPRPTVCCSRFVLFFSGSLAGGESPQSAGLLFVVRGRGVLQERSAPVLSEAFSVSNGMFQESEGRDLFTLNHNFQAFKVR